MPVAITSVFNAKDAVAFTAYDNQDYGCFCTMYLTIYKGNPVEKLIERVSFSINEPKVIFKLFALMQDIYLKSYIKPRNLLMIWRIFNRKNTKVASRHVSDQTWLQPQMVEIPYSVHRIWVKMICRIPFRAAYLTSKFIIRIVFQQVWGSTRPVWEIQTICHPISQASTLHSLYPSSFLHKA